MENVPAVPWGKVAAIGRIAAGDLLTIKGVAVLVSMASRRPATGCRAASCPGGASSASS